jgi:hypothetical protein
MAHARFPIIASFVLAYIAVATAFSPRGFSRVSTRRYATLTEVPTASEKVAVAKVTVEEKKMFDSPTFKFLDFLLGIPIVHDVLFGVYRKQVVEKAEKMGIPWTAFMDDMWGSLPELRTIAKEIKDPAVTIPDYFHAPIHAYKDGNLCWESAMEEDLWSKMMIAPLYNNAIDGDVQMRQQWLTITDRVIKTGPKQATDLGCGTGLSMYMLDGKWPSLEKVTGVDLSTYKLAIAENKKKEMVRSKLYHVIAANASMITQPFISSHHPPSLRSHHSTLTTFTSNI